MSEDNKRSDPVSIEDHGPPNADKKKKGAGFLIFSVPAAVCVFLLYLFGGFYIDLFVIRDNLSIVRFIPLLIFTFAFGLKIFLCVISDKKIIRNIPLYITIICYILLFSFAAIYGYEAIVGSLVYGSMVTIALPGMAAGSIVYHYSCNISLSDEKKSKNKIRLKKASLICISLVFFTVAGYSLGLFLKIVPSCGDDSHSAAVWGNEVFYYEDNYPYRYDLTAREKEQTYTKAGEPYTNSLGLFVTGAHDGVYRITDDNIKLIIEFEGTVGEDEKLQMVDITENRFFWKVISENGDKITQTIYSGEYTGNLDELQLEIPDNITLIHSYEEKKVTPAKVIADKLYYFSSELSGSVKCVDITSKEESVLLSGEGSEYSIEKVYFFDDCFLIICPDGIYSADYDGNTRFLTEYVPLTEAFDRKDDKVYFVTERTYGSKIRKEIVSLSLDNAKVKTYVRLNGSGGIGHNVSEIVITPYGFVFTDPSATSKGGLYFYNVRHEKIIRISR